VHLIALSRSPLAYFFGRLGTTGGARPVDTPGLEGIDGGGRGTPERDMGRLGTMG